jgi:penicillin-binding protein 1C
MKKPKKGQQPVNEREGYIAPESSISRNTPNIVRIPTEPYEEKNQEPSVKKTDYRTQKPEARSQSPERRTKNQVASRQSSPVVRGSSSVRRSSGLARAFLTLALLVFVGFFAFAAVGAGAYIYVASQLPDVGALETKTSDFASTKIVDQSGKLLIELTDPTNPKAGSRQYVPISQISEWLKKATIATEDPNFYKYQVGFDPIAIVRVFYLAWQEKDFVSGGSTITQQVARNLLLSPQERTERSFTRKMREIILANELTRKYPRDKILEIYLNEIFYANQAYGIQAASQTYFSKDAKDLNLAEASFLAGIPQSPVLWDPVKNKDNTLKRQNDVLRLMVKAEFIEPSKVFDAQREMEARTFRAPQLNVPNFAQHYFFFVRDQLEKEYGKSGLYKRGLRVTVSLDERIQKIAEAAVKNQITKLKDKNVTNASVVVLKPQTGEILAMVGSADFFDDKIDGQVNVAISPQQPGSSIKPFTYLFALEKGATPATLFWDQKKTFTNQWGQTYTPRNYDGKFHGAMLMREALARSMNIPAVETLEYVGVPQFVSRANQFGIDFPPNDQYGLAITLGGADSTLMNMTNAYATLANGGVKFKPTAITKVESLDGSFSKDYRKDIQGEQIVRPEHAYLVTNMLSDNNARLKTFGRNNPLNLPFPAAAKTGTTNDFRDNLTIGYTPDLVVGVWVGNTDNSEMKGVSGITGAAPIWREVMLNAHENLPKSEFVRPQGVVEMEICAEGGRQPSPSCAKRVKEIFKSDQLPLPPDENIERAARENNPDIAVAPPPPQASPQTPDVIISQPANGSAYGQGLLSIRGTINPPGFQNYQVEYGEGDNPVEWKWVSGPHLSPVINEQLTEFNISGVNPGRYTLRVTVNTSQGALVGYSRFDVNP